MDVTIHTSPAFKGHEYHAHIVLRDLSVINAQGNSWDSLIKELYHKFISYKNKDKN